MDQRMGWVAKSLLIGHCSTARTIYRCPSTHALRTLPHQARNSWDHSTPHPSQSCPLLLQVHPNTPHVPTMRCDRSFWCIVLHSMSQCTIPHPTSRMSLWFYYAQIRNSCEVRSQNIDCLWISHRIVTVNVEIYVVVTWTVVVELKNTVVH